MKNRLNSKSTLKSTIAETKANLTKVVVAEDKRPKVFTRQSSPTIEVVKEVARQT